MPEKHLHIISFNIPYPANYGGVIDVYYKLRALHKMGIKIHLHCFKYDRDGNGKLASICHKVHYYKRRTSLLAALGIKPYIVASRRSEQLLHNLLQNDYPILFEGLHSCYYIDHPKLKDRTKIYRESNIEHDYYYNLAKAERNLLKKTYFYIASIKLKHYQKVLEHAQLMLTVSKADTRYLQEHFPHKKVIHLPSFHPSDDFNVLTGKGNYALYHGNLSVPENTVAAEFLAKEVFYDSKIPLVVAGLNPPESLKRIANNGGNMKLVANPGDEEMFDLIRNAQVNVLVTFQGTGLKLKLLNTLYNGRHVIVNKTILNGTGLDALCTVRETAEEISKSVAELFDKKFDTAELQRRSNLLNSNYSNKVNAERLIEYIFGE
ncbi:MAG TPA: glycosyltransferase family 1 protein [Bacteroidales bacterium]|nr:glycosyltransferase family 1 protein [Bacteroidales bacterium]